MLRNLVTFRLRNHHDDDFFSSPTTRVPFWSLDPFSSPYCFCLPFFIGWDKKRNAFRNHRLAYHARCAVGSLQWKSTITWSVPKHIRSVANVFVNNFRVRLFIRAFSDVFFGTVHVTFVCPMRHILCIFVIRKEIFFGFSCCAAFVSDPRHGERNLWLCKRDDYSTFNRPFQLYTVSVLLWIGRHWSFNLGVVVTSLTFQHKIYDTRTQRDGLRFTEEEEKRKNEARKL